MKRARYFVRLNQGHTARFSDRGDAFEFAREKSKLDSLIYAGGGMVEVTDSTGLIAQFCDGYTTPEFAHIDVPAWRAKREIAKAEG